MHSAITSMSMVQIELHVLHLRHKHNKANTKNADCLVSSRQLVKSLSLNNHFQDQKKSPKEEFYGEP